ncbi:hypothetical protein BC628DRAFT_1421971 [Trametes gibbosa]|uniref:Zinc finger protein 229 n=1 Tax=Trametes gibbosa TaxID=160864 RepID=A0A6B9KD28_9APHY|nr:hypothetical protein BC628DRAFT_1421971 [Trametes gibbosa]QHA24602.1 zinc finger protein 229 [Trametes gibbosa]
MQTNNHLEQVDIDMEWLAREAPQFHTSVEAPRRLPSTQYPQARESDDASSSSDNDSCGSNSDDEDDPYHPYNFQDPSKKWIRNGNFVYAADDLHDSFLAEEDRVAHDAPYVPPSVGQPKDKGQGAGATLFLAPDDFETDIPYERYAYPDRAPPHQPQTLSPLDLTASLPSSPGSTSLPHAPARRRRARGPSPRSAARSPPNGYRHGSDDEADTSSGGDDASEDEYIPSPRASSRKLPPSSRIQAQTRTKPARLSYSPYPSSSTSSASAAESSSRRPGSRNVQIIDQAPPPRGQWAKTGPGAYKCPYCEHVQRNKRSPDMERHIRSHFRRAAHSQWVCCGLPLEEAVRLGHGGAAHESVWEFNGVLMVGGCREDFSRMDALKRHWRNANNSCIGDVRYARVKDASFQ